MSTSHGFPTIAFGRARTPSSELAQVREQLRLSQAQNVALQRALSDAQRAERLRLASLVHDDLGQHLVAMRAQLAVLGLIADSTLQPNVTTLTQNCQALQDGFRRLLGNLDSPPVGELRETLQAIARRWQHGHGAHCYLHLATALPTLPPSYVREIALLVQEALTNVAKHAGASSVRLRVQVRGACLYLLLGDNGLGALANTPGLGLLSMTRRARELGAELAIARRQSRGWTLLLRLPMENLQ